MEQSELTIRIRDCFNPGVTVETAYIGQQVYGCSWRQTEQDDRDVIKKRLVALKRDGVIELVGEDPECWRLVGPVKEPTAAYERKAILNFLAFLRAKATSNGESNSYDRLIEAIDKGKQYDPVVEQWLKAEEEVVARARELSAANHALERVKKAKFP